LKKAVDGLYDRQAGFFGPRLTGGRAISGVETSFQSMAPIDHPPMTGTLSAQVLP
jgi:hypothetical protein